MCIRDSRYDEQGLYPFEKVKPIITEILKTVIADGKGIEVNTSNHRYGIADMTPSRDILKLYRELGGTIITIGSDSHKKEHLGAYIDWAKEELRKLGYTQFCTFEKMKPVLDVYKRQIIEWGIDGYWCLRCILHDSSFWST